MGPAEASSIYLPCSEFRRVFSMDAGFVPVAVACLCRLDTPPLPLGVGPRATRPPQERGCPVSVVEDEDGPQRAWATV